MTDPGESRRRATSDGNDAVMTPARWQRIEQLYHDACTLSAAERAVFLARTCGDDVPLRREVEILLAQAASAGGFLDNTARNPARWPDSAALPTGAATSPNESWLIGQQLGSYRVSARLGAGGMDI
jgi:eukaryotic-like serine/threonine-protein kinase